MYLMRPSELISILRNPISWPKSPVKSTRTMAVKSSNCSSDRTLLAVLANEELLEVEANPVGADKGVPNRNVCDNCIKLKEGRRTFDVEGVNSLYEHIDEFLHGGSSGIDDGSVNDRLAH